MAKIGNETKLVVKLAKERSALNHRAVQDIIEEQKLSLLPEDIRLVDFMLLYATERYNNILDGIIKELES